MSLRDRKCVMKRYVIITPVRDEEQYLEATIASVAGQTISPSEWVIVNDGSTDGTGKIIDRYAAQFPWIHVVHRPNGVTEKLGAALSKRLMPATTRSSVMTGTS